MDPEPDRETLIQAAQGDAVAFRHVVEAYQGLAYNLAYRYVFDRHAAEDMAQECFVRLHRNFPQYDAERPFRPWFLRLVANTCLNWLRQERRHRPLRAGIEAENRSAGDVPDRAVAEDDPAEAATRREAHAAVRAGVEALPPEYRAVVGLRYFEGLEYGEIAEILQVPLGTVKIRLFRAREVLRRRLEPLVEVATA